MPRQEIPRRPVGGIRRPEFSFTFIWTKAQPRLLLGKCPRSPSKLAIFANRGRLEAHGGARRPSIIQDLATAERWMRISVGVFPVILRLATSASVVESSKVLRAQGARVA